MMAEPELHLSSSARIFVFADNKHQDGDTKWQPWQNNSFTVFSNVMTDKWEQAQYN